MATYPVGGWPPVPVIVTMFLMAWAIPHYLVGVLQGSGAPVLPAAGQRVLFAQRFMGGAILGFVFLHYQYQVFVTEGTLIINVSLGGRNVCNMTPSPEIRLRYWRRRLAAYELLRITWWRGSRRRAVWLHASDLSKLVFALRDAGFAVEL